MFLGISASTFINTGGWLGFALKAAICVVIYALVVYLIGLKKDEKATCNKFVRKIIKLKDKTT
ncbi:MAG: hypothetical protein J6Q85_05555 [Clostridia bacterium]|nr:hypothetical protein [Clostridia bacterium]